jgi:Mrp family chromosome partitioning ATPase
MSKHFELMQKIEEDRQPKVHAAPELAGRNSRAKNSSVPPRWASDETLRLVHQIFLSQTEGAPRLVVFAGIDPGNGCSEICASVAESLAKGTRGRVCLVEANFHSPTLPHLFQTTNFDGLTEALDQRDQPMASYAKPTMQENLWLLSSGRITAYSSQLLHSDDLRERLLELRESFDYVVIDAPPLTRYSEGIAIGQAVDGLVLILEAEATHREAASAVAANLRAANIPILAAVLNKRNFPIPEKIYRHL